MLKFEKYKIKNHSVVVSVLYLIFWCQLSWCQAIGNFSHQKKSAPAAWSTALPTSTLTAGKKRNRRPGRFMAVSTTTIESLSGSMKSSAFAIEMKTSVLMRSGMPYFRMKSSTESSSWRLMNSWSHGLTWYKSQRGYLWEANFGQTKFGCKSLMELQKNLLNPLSVCSPKKVSYPWGLKWNQKKHTPLPKKRIAFPAHNSLWPSL